MNQHATGGVGRREFVRQLGAAGVALALADTARAEAAAPVPRRKLGRHSDELSILMPGGHTLAKAESQDEAVRILHAAVDAGINAFDNAWDYMDGRAEEWMGAGLAGRRDKAFLMSKMCTHGQGRDVGMRQLEESLKRLRTDHLDLWMLHALQTEEEVTSAYAPGGALEALTEAKRQGKVRYLGFTGHASPSLHLKMLEGGFAFDAVLMPLSVFDGARPDGFQKRVLPELLKRNIAPLAMKSLAGNARAVKDGFITAAEAIRYALSLPITTLALGIDKREWLEAGLKFARSFTPMTEAERSALEVRCREGTRYEGYRG